MEVYFNNKMTFCEKFFFPLISFHRFYRQYANQLNRHSNWVIVGNKATALFAHILNKNKREHKHMEHPMSTDQILLRICTLFFLIKAAFLKTIDLLKLAHKACEITSEPLFFYSYSFRLKTKAKQNDWCSSQLAVPTKERLFLKELKRVRVKEFTSLGMIERKIDDILNIQIH